MGPEGQGTMSHTFDSLTNAKNRELKALMKTGAEPALEELLGFEFQGWNNNATTRFTGTRKFKKGFFGMPGRDLAWGYNVAVEQNSKSEPWIPKKKDGEIVRHYFFGICRRYRKAARRGAGAAGIPQGDLRRAPARAHRYRPRPPWRS